MVNKNIKDWSSDELFDGVLCDPPYELGFMGKSWDSSGIAYDVEMWRNIFDHLKPGAHLLAFSGSRTYHRMACAIEDAGFEIRDMIEYIYGSGFPKSLNIGKAVDKLQGNEREDLGKHPTINGKGDHFAFCANYNGARLTKGTSEWEGYGTALKPAHEPCVLARKPIEGTVAQNALKHGTGGINIDECRVKTEDKLSIHKGNLFAGNSGIDTKQNFETDGQSLGRFPANLIHDGSDEVVGLFPDTGKSTGGRIGNKGSMINTMGNNYEAGDPGFGDSGSAARFFYTAKASKSERNAGLEGLPEDIGVGNYMSDAKWINDPRHKDGGYLAAPSKPQANHHPTIKPLSLTKYLATLIKPPTGGRLLVPFSGSGSEMIGALQAGWDYVEGIELTEEYIPIAEARIKYWTKQPVQEELL